MDEPLLTRDQFRERVFARDGGKCVFCGKPGVDAHHIMERRLWPDGGYYLSNGATLCEWDHLSAESTSHTCEDVRAAAGIAKVLLPPHLYPDHRYDKWGNPYLDDYYRLRGELFEDESVQKVLGPLIATDRFKSHVKYGRTMHLPWSPGISNDDRVSEDLSELESAKRIIVHVKMDGENTSMYSDFIHARSADVLGSHPSRTRVKSLWGRIAHDIPEGWRVCAENLQGKHSIHYKNLRDWVYGFSVWDDKNVCLPWDMTKIWLELLDITPCPVIYDGPWDETKLRKLWTPTFEGDECEGYVVRVADEFPYKDFRKKVAKYVRKGHVQTHAHWMQQFVSNEVRER
jgi:hypothetical protein